VQKVRAILFLVIGATILVAAVFGLLILWVPFDWNFEGGRVRDGINLILLAGLALITLLYAWSTHQIAEKSEEEAIATKELAEASKKQIEESVKARENAFHPVVVFSKSRRQALVDSVGSVSNEAAIDINETFESPGTFPKELHNLGSGVALNILVSFMSSQGEVIGYPQSLPPLGLSNYVRIGLESNLIAASVNERQIGSIKSIIIEYEDIFRKKHFTKVSRLHLGNGELRISSDFIFNEQSHCCERLEF
jgi:hypothetical protein